MPYKTILCLCEHGFKRSTAAAEEVRDYANSQNVILNVISRGLYNGGSSELGLVGRLVTSFMKITGLSEYVRATAEDFEKADLIYVMTQGMKDFVTSKYSVSPEKVVNLNIHRERGVITRALRREVKTKIMPSLVEFVSREFAELSHSH